MSTKNDTNRGDCYPYTIQENKNEPFIISRACPPNCVEDKIKEALSANNEKWEEKIKELGSINESHRKLNGELREQIKGLEETKGTYSQSTIKLLERIKDLEEKYDNAEEAINSLFKQLGDAIHKACELEELIPTKEEAESIINALDENYSGDKEIIAKLQKIAGMN